MLKRIISSVIAFPIIVLIIWFGGLPFKLLMILISLTGMFELYKAMNKKNNAINFISYIFIVVYYLFIDNLDTDTMLIIFFLYILSNLIFFVMNHAKISPVECAVNVFGFFYVGFLMSAIYLTRIHPYGQFLVWLIFVGAWGSDTFAYFTGVAIGKHKLAPVLSPKKTVEGAVGGVLGSMLLGFIYALVLSRYTNISHEINVIFLFVAISGFSAGFSILGDLSASAIKRYTKIKDYGSIIPGHGGIMDRFDSILFTAPIVYAVLRILISYY